MNKTQLGESWFNILQEELAKPYFKSLMNQVIEEYGKTKVYPGPSDVFKAFRLTPFEQVKVVIIGQD